MVEDEIIKEVWRVRDEIAARFDYDVRAIGAYYLRLQEESGIPTVSLSPRKPVVTVISKRANEQNGNGDKPKSQFVQANGAAARAAELNESLAEIEEYTH